MKKKGIERGA